jgi:CRISPR system Cascade subunit CasC
MTDFLQLHLLTTYPPSNPNRDDLGRPKTAIVGGRMRQRISSQAIKRAVRESEAFCTALVGHKGERTQRLGDEIIKHLVARGADPVRADEIARSVATVFGAIDDDANARARENGRTPARIAQLAFISPAERDLAFQLAGKALVGETLPTEELVKPKKGKNRKDEPRDGDGDRAQAEKASKALQKAIRQIAPDVLLRADGAVDIAMFGRMLAATPEFNREAAVQVAHAFTTNAVDIEDDYYTAVDDLKEVSEDAGAAFVDEAGFGAGVYYLYVCVNRDLLVKNLDEDRVVAARGLQALIRALAESSPTGKRNSFANHVRAEFLLAERGDAQPRSLAAAFTLPVEAGDQLAVSVKRLLEKRAAFAKAYGQDWREERVLHVGAPDSATLDDIAAFAAAGLGDAP